MIFEGAPFGMVVYDRELTVTECNRAFARMLHRSTERIVGVHVDRLPCRRHREALIEALGGRTITLALASDGPATPERRWNAATFTPLYDRAKEITGVMALVVDRTRHVAAAVEHDLHEFLSILTDHLPSERVLPTSS